MAAGGEQDENDFTDDDQNVVVSAGNDTTDACGVTPARVAEAVTVGASTSGDFRAPFSNYGDCLKLFAPGQAVAAVSPDGTVGTTNGTSFAAPYVTGTFALMLQERPGLTPFNFRLMTSAYSTAVALNDAGAGSPNRLLYSPHTEISDPLQGPDSFSCTVVGNATWFTATWGGDGTYSYSWVIAYDNPLQDDQVPTTTSNTLTWLVDGSKGSFTVRASVLTYIDSRQASRHVTVGPC